MARMDEVEPVEAAAEVELLPSGAARPPAPGRPVHAPDPARHRLALAPLAQNAAAGRWRTEAMRSHSSPRVIFVTRGQGRITIAGLTSGYGPNNLFFIPAGTMFGYETGPMVHGHVLSIPAAMAAEWPEEAVHLRLRDVVAQKEITGILDNLERELTATRTGHARAALYHAGLLAVYLERQIESRPPNAVDPRSQSAAARLVAAYTDLMERDFRTGRGVAAFAADLGVTATHLTRCCRQTCGRTALALLNDRIFFEARILLRDTDLPVQRIASGLGFASAAYFTRSFRAATGFSPSQFRRLAPSQGG